MAEVVTEDRRVDIIQQWNALNEGHQGFSLSYQLFESGVYSAFFEGEDGFLSALCCLGADQFSYYSARDKLLISAQPEIEGDIILNGIVDLSDDGSRWEGSLKGSVPYGYGCLYDPMNRLVYEGYMAQEKKILWGKSYHADLGIVAYEGGFCNNERMGHGVEKDRQGQVSFDGVWVYGRQQRNRILKIASGLSVTSLCNQVEQILLSNNAVLPSEKVLIVNFPLLKNFRIGAYHHYINVDNKTDLGSGELYFIHCPKLEQVVFGYNSCYNFKKLVCRGCLDACVLTYRLLQYRSDSHWYKLPMWGILFD